MYLVIIKLFSCERCDIFLFHFNYFFYNFEGFVTTIFVIFYELISVCVLLSKFLYKHHTEFSTLKQFENIQLLLLPVANSHL